MIRQRLQQLEKDADRKNPHLTSDGYPACTLCHGPHRRVIDCTQPDSDLNQSETSPYCPQCGRPNELQELPRIVILPSAMAQLSEEKQQ